MTSNLPSQPSTAGAAVLSGPQPPVRLTLVGFLASVVVGVLLFIPGFGIPALLFFLHRYTFVRSLSVRATVIAGAVLTLAFWVGAFVSTTYMEVWVGAGVITGFLFPFAYVIGGLIINSSNGGRRRGQSVSSSGGTLALAKVLFDRLTGGPVRRAKEEQYRRLLEVERATTAQERCLLLAREFGRLAGDALGIDPSDRSTWPLLNQLQDLQRQAHVLLSSATDSQVYLPPGPADAGGLSQETLVAAIQELTQYLDLVSKQRALTSLSPEHLRVWARDRGNLQRIYDEVLRQMQVL